MLALLNPIGLFNRGVFAVSKHSGVLSLPKGAALSVSKGRTLNFGCRFAALALGRNFDRSGLVMETAGTSVLEQLEKLEKLLEKSRNTLPESFWKSFNSQLLGLKEQVEKLTEPILNVGLLGGTGVGKSTIVNALAGDEISSVSDRRPHTDLVVVYRHRTAEVPVDIPVQYLKEPHKVHENDSIRDIIIYDFPDFDSILAEHAQRVLGMLDVLDISVWVVSPEKYADLEFYRVLKRSSKHQDNFVFVMNKVDMIKASGTGAERELKGLLGDFAVKLKKAGILAPRIHAFAALKITDPGAPAWQKEDFYNFREYLFRERNAKEVLAIKEANIEVHIRELVDNLKHLYEKYKQLPVDLDAVLMEFQKEFYDLKDVIPAVTKELIDAEMVSEIKEHASNDTHDVSPVRFIKRILEITLYNKRFSRVIVSERTIQSRNDQNIAPIRNRFRSVFSRIATVLHRYGMTSAQDEIAQLEEITELELKGMTGEVKQWLFEYFEETRGRENRLKRWANKARQLLYLGFPVLFLAISLAGIDSIKNFLARPAPGKGLSLLFNMVLSLYTAHGLISLASFLLIELIVLFLLASGSIRKDERKLAMEMEKINDYLAFKMGKRLEYMKKRIDVSVQKIVEKTRIADRLLDELALKTK